MTTSTMAAPETATKRSKALIRAERLTRFYGERAAIEELSFSCRRGEIVGFLGPNGAGKTTTMRILAGYLPPSSGAAFIAGHHTVAESLAARRRLGYLPETVRLYPEMTPHGYLSWIGRLRRLDDRERRVAEALAAVNLADRAQSLLGDLSRGMRQRVGLAQAILHRPDALILDEPTLGLDPGQVVEVRNLIRTLGAGAGGEAPTILLSTHILSEVEQLCDRVIILIDGRIWADMPLAQITGAGEEAQLRLHLAAPTRDTVTVLRNLAGIRAVEAERGGDGGAGAFRVWYDGREETRSAIAGCCVNAGWGLLELAGVRPTLEAVFLSRLREAEAAALGEAAAGGEGG